MTPVSHARVGPLATHHGTSAHLDVDGLLDDRERDLAISGELDRDAVAADLARVGVKATDTLVSGLLHEAREHAERRELEDEQRKRINALDVPTYELPRLPDGIDLGALYELAADLCRQGLA